MGKNQTSIPAAATVAREDKPYTHFSPANVAMPFLVIPNYIDVGGPHDKRLSLN
jgi:hypothetical protein